MVGLWFMVFNTTFNNISVISWRIGCIGGENHLKAHLILQTEHKNHSINPMSKLKVNISFV
jgi:hypothetical protein